MNTYYSLKNSSLLEAIHPSSTSPQKSIDAPLATASANEASLAASYASPVAADRRSQCLDSLADQPSHAFAYPTSASVPMSVLGEPQAAMDDSGAYYHYLACSTDPEATKLAASKDIKPMSLRMKPGAANATHAHSMTASLIGNGGAGGSSSSTSSGDNVNTSGFTPYQTTDLLDPIESSVFYWWLDELGQPQPMTAATSTRASPSHMYMYNEPPFPQPSQLMAPSPAHQGSKSVPPSQPFFYPQAQHALMPLQARGLASNSASVLSSPASQRSESTAKAFTSETGYADMPSSPSLSTTTSPSNADCVSDSGRPLRKRTYKKTRLTEAQKRDNHLASEQKRRGHYKQAVENLVNILPKPGHGEADRSQCHLIWRAVHFIRSLEQSNQSLAYQLQQPLIMAPSQSQGNPHGNASARSGGSFITM